MSQEQDMTNEVQPTSGAFTLTKQDNGVAILSMDVPGESMNTLKAEFGDEISAMLDDIERDSSIKGVVLTSGKPSSFVAGADITMLAACKTAEDATTIAAGGQAIFDRIENMKVKHGYPKPLAASIQASSAELGVLIPPSIPLILYGVSTDTSIGQLFLAGIGPGILIGSALILFLYLFCKVRGYGKDDYQDSTGFMVSLKRAWVALLMPVVVIGGIYGGIFTPTEASAVAVFFALFAGGFYYRELKLADVLPILRQSVISTAAVMLIIASAALFSFLLSRTGLPAQIATLVTNTIESPMMFLLVVNALLLIVGMFIETSAAILVLAPILTPIALQFGIHPVHFGLVMVVNLALGMITPPLGVNLFAACAVAKISIDQMLPWLVRFVLVVLACLMAITYMPWISMGLVTLFYG